MHWGLLVIAGILEIVWASCMKQAHGFTRLGPSICTLVSMMASFVLLALALLVLCYYLLIYLPWYLGLWPDFLYGLEPVQFLMWHWFIPLFTGDHELLRLGPLVLSGGFLFLVLNR